VELLEAIRCAPTTRRFLPDPVKREQLLAALDVARFAPSGGNRQPWRVIVVEDPRTRRALRDLYQPHWQRYMEATGGAAALADATLAEDPRLNALRAADRFARTLEIVPVHIVIWAELASIAIVDRELQRPSIVGGASIYPFVQNLLLALRGQGLGAALTTLLAPAEAQVKELLGVPDGLALAAYVLVGKRADPWPTRLSRRPLAEVAFAERYGAPLVSGE
jgi:nitroreductase